MVYRHLLSHKILKLCVDVSAGYPDHRPFYIGLVTKHLYTFCKDSLFNYVVGFLKCFSKINQHSSLKKETIYCVWTISERLSYMEIYKKKIILIYINQYSYSIKTNKYPVEFFILFAFMQLIILSSFCSGFQ